MKKFLFFTIAYCIGIGVVDAAVRNENSVNRNTSNTTSASIIARATTTTKTNSQNLTPTNTTGRTTDNTISRSTVQTNNTIQTNLSRSATSQRKSTSNTTTSRNTARSSVVRDIATPRTSVTPSARSALSPGRAATNTFGNSYNACRDAYFTCMDQFCATANDSYRRCICSSRLADIQAREKALSQSSDQLQDFIDLNIDVIPKTSEEVSAMLSATEGESSIKKDTSESSQQLAGISAVLANTKSNSLSTLGTLDIAGDINQIWATTDLASGENIVNLTGESLYNAVHSQCVNLVSDNCTSSATLNMVIAAYGMYIENDCTTLLNALDKNLNQANSAIRDTEREMNLARLENYNAHNSSSINDCIAMVRKDITADTACGENYVHCLDVTGQYLNQTTGEPIYSENFYQLEAQTSLSGDILTNSTNRLLVAELNRKRSFAENSLETCRDISDEVWDEFMRQAITEIYQKQQNKIREVKEECLEVVNACYDEKNQSLKDFSNIKEELLLGSRLELSEELCKEKLYTCSNLYGDPDGDGLTLLISAMQNITDQKIAQECATLLKDFAKDTCSVTSSDSLHAYPYGCRVYAPGDQIYATSWYCNQFQQVDNSFSDEDWGTPQLPDVNYNCTSNKTYTKCSKDYYMVSKTDERWSYDPEPKKGNRCAKCPNGSTCAGGTYPPIGGAFGDIECGSDYSGSLYQKMVKYAVQVCVRPSETDAITSGTKQIPTNVLEDINVVMDTIRVEMATELSKECERLGGVWFDTQWLDENDDDKHDKTNHSLFKGFYDETGSNTKWGYCADKNSVSTLSN